MYSTVRMVRDRYQEPFCEDISGLVMAMEIANSRQEIWNPYLWPCVGNEKG